MAKFICICYGQWRILRSKFKEDKMVSSEMEKKKKVVVRKIDV